MRKKKATNPLQINPEYATNMFQNTCKCIANTLLICLTAANQA